MRNLLSMLKIYKKELLLGPFLKLLEAIIEISLPIIIASLIDEAISSSIHDLLPKAFFMLFLVMLGAICACLAQYYAAKASTGYGLTVRNSLFDHILNLSTKQIETLGSSSLTNRIINDTSQLEIAVSMWIRLVVRVPLICLGSFFMTFLLNKKLSFILLFFTLLFSIAIFLIAKKASPLHKKTNQKLDQLITLTKETLVNMRVVRSFSNEEKETDKFSNSNKATYQIAKRANLLSNLLSPITTFILNIAVIVILSDSRVQITSSLLTQGELIAILNYISQMLVSVILLSNLITIYTRSFASASRIGEILSITPDLKDGYLQDFPSTKTSIEFSNVSFSFHKEPFMENLNLTIQQGEIVGIIGLTASGKSSLLQLINRSYDISDGTLFLFENKIQNYNLSFLKQSIRLIEQNPRFLTGTIRQNVTMGLELPDEIVFQALEMADLSDFILTLSSGLDTRVENNASNLSGGQKQRLALSRGFTTIPKVLMLDNSTSALDLKTENTVIANAIQFAKAHNITLLIASQKISTIKKADRIFLFDNGKIDAIGTHNNLLKQNTLYQEIFHMQFKGKEESI